MSPPDDESAVASSDTAPSSDAARTDALTEVAKEMDEIRRLALELTSLLEQAIQRAQQVEDASVKETSELLTLLAAVRPLRVFAAQEPPAPSKLDEYIEDMIDPEFGLRPARTVISQAAERILNGYDAFHMPRRRGSSDGSDGSSSG